MASAAGLTEPDGRPLNLRRGLIVDACATLGAGLAGTSSGTAFVESIAGIRVGARTGRASVVTALCFLPCLFIAPLAAAVPPYATAPVLVLVGLSMFQMVGALDFRTIEDSLPAFVTIVLIPLTLSITQGILWGFILHACSMSVGRASSRAEPDAVDPRRHFSRPARPGEPITWSCTSNDPTVLWRMTRGRSTAHATIFPGAVDDDGDVVFRRRDGSRRELRLGGAGAGAGRRHPRDPAPRWVEREPEAADLGHRTRAPS